MTAKIKLATKRQLKKIVSDSRILEEKLKEPTFRYSVENLLRAFSDKGEDFRFFVGRLNDLCGDGALPLKYVLHMNDSRALDGVRKAGVSKEVADFLAEMMAKFGQAFDRYQRFLENPDDWRTLNWEDHYCVKDKELVIAMHAIKENEEVITIEGPARSFLSLAKYILRHIVISHKKHRDDLPNLKLKFEKKTINDIKRYIENIGSLST